jgi:hypothetical protein
MEALRERALEQAERHGGGVIRSITLRVGSLAGVELEALELAEQRARQLRDQANASLSAARRQAAAALEQQLMQALRPMGLANVRFAVAIAPAPAGEEGVRCVMGVGTRQAPWSGPHATGV